VEAIPINLDEVYSGVRPDLNLRLRGGDMLYCPERRREFFYVLGDVNRPGALEIVGSEEVRASRAISMAGGPTRTARTKRAVLIRYGASGVREEFAVDFRRMVRGRGSDVVVRPNDVIVIPGSNAKTLGYGLLGAIPGVALGVALLR